MMNVEIQSAWLSKINWTQIVGFVAMVLAMYGVKVPPDLQAATAVALTAVVAVVTIIWRTFFTSTVTPAVADK